MAASLDDVKERIKARVPLDQLIGETVTLVRRGSSVTACCPFHADKSPSFHVYPDNHYYCFGCKENGDAITFVRKTRELSFVESLKYLANKFGIEAPELEESDSLKRRRGEHATLTQMMVAAQDLFVSELKTERGADARQYLRDRGFSDENIAAFGFGLTPMEGFGLVRHLRGLGFREEDMIRASLAGISAKSGRPYDFFRERIMIPIRDAQGRVIAFGGRTTAQDPAKYKNSGATSLFDKSGVLFGLDQAREPIKDMRRAVIVEGYMDTLCLWQGGLREVVAAMGTALTVRQLKLLQQHTKTPEAIVLFDGDDPGQKATLDAIDVVLEVPGLVVKAAKLTGGEDPDSFVRKHGADALRDILAASVDLIDVAIGARLRGASLAAIPNIVSQDFVPWLARVQDPVKLSYLVSRISGLTGVGVDVMTRQLRTFQFAPRRSGASSLGGASARSGFESAGSFRSVPVGGEEPEAAERVLPTRPLTPVEKGLLGHIYFAEIGEIDASRVSAFLTSELSLEPLWELFGRLMIQSYAKGIPAKNDPALLAAFTPEESRVLATLTAVAPGSFATADRAAAVEHLITEQKRNEIKQSIALLKRQVQIAASQSPQDVPRFLNEVMSLTQKLAGLDQV